MASPRVVEALNILRDCQGRRRAAPPIVAVNELMLDRREEALADSIVPAIPFAAHAADNVEFCQSVPVQRAGVLGAPIRMMQEAGVGKAPTKGHVQCIEHERRPHVIGGRPANHPTLRLPGSYR